nr:hypothetical protein [Tanacetum cinerariifolium]
MAAFLCKSVASVGFDQIVDFLNAQVIQYALMVNPTIYVSCIKQFWTAASIKKVNDVANLRALIDGKRVVVSKDVIRHDLRLDDANGVECLLNEEIFTELARMGYEKPPPKLTFYKAFFSAQWKFLIHTLVQCISAKRTAGNEFSCSMASAVICLATGRKFNFPKYIFDSMVGKGFLGVETPLFATMLVQPQPPATEEEDEVEVPSDPNPPSPIIEPTLHPQEPISTTTHAQPALSSPPQAQPQIDIFESSMSILNTLMETCATLSQKVAHLEQDKVAQALEILKLKKKVKKLEKQMRSKSLGLKRGRIEAINADEEITLVDMETQVDLGAEVQGRKDDDNATIKEASVTEPTVFDDKEVTMTMAQTLIKMKAKKAIILDEQMA